MKSINVNTDEALDIYYAMQTEKNQENLNLVREDARDLKDFLVRGVKLPKTGTHGTKKGRAAWLNHKISEAMTRWGTLYGSTVEEVCDNIISDNSGWLCSIFAKDPAKQNLSEQVHAAMMEAAGLDFEDLPNRGENQITFINGKKQYGSIPSSQREFGLNCDFCVNPNIYTTNKITKGRGGLQEAQVKCVVHWLKEVIKYIEKNPSCTERFAAIVDGTTYTMTDNKHLTDLQNMVVGYEKMIFVGSMRDFINSSFLKINSGQLT